MNSVARVKGKEVEATISSQAPAPTQPAEVPAAQSPTLLLSLDTKYWAVCTPLGKLYPNKHPITLDWKKDLVEENEEERIEQDKVKDNFVCSNWDTDLEEYHRKKSGVRRSKEQGQ